MNNFDTAVATTALFMGMVVAGGICMLVILLVSIFVDVPLLTSFLVVALVSIVGGMGFGIFVQTIQKKARR